jgi:4-amino-4-deoxy-L-arabinose transferase-like glycosyltransferase
LGNYDNIFEKKIGKIYSSLKEYSSYLSFILLILILTVIVYYRVMIQIEIGPIWDTCDFLSNALVFAGQGTGYADLTRPPLLSFLTSLFFRLGYVSPIVIFALDGAIFLFGVIGFYLLLKIRFNDIESFLGTLLFVTFPVILSFAGSGLTDVPSLSFSIWVIYFTVLAVKKNSKFFYLAFPFLMLAFLTRYAIAFTIFPLMLYVIINKRLVKDIKDILIGIFVSFLALVPVLLFFYSTFGSPLHSFAMFFSATTTSSPISPENFAYHPNFLYFILKSPVYIGSVGTTILLIILLGIFIYMFMQMRKGKWAVKKSLKNIFKVKNNFTKIKLLLIVILSLIFVATLGKINYMGSEVIFFILAYFSYWIFKNQDINYMDLNFLFLSWFMAFFIFHSVYVMKDDRYFLTMTPAVSYFLILGLSGVSNMLSLKIKNRNVTLYLFAIILTVMMLVSTIQYLPGIKETNSDFKNINENMKAASQWLVNYDSNYANKTIYSDDWPYTGWYLRTYVGMMPIFKDNQKFYCGVKHCSFNSNDNKAFNSYLDSNNVDYYFCVRKGLNLTGYKPIKQFNNLVLYERVD